MQSVFGLICGLVFFMATFLSLFVSKPDAMLELSDIRLPRLPVPARPDSHCARAVNSSALQARSAAVLNPGRCRVSVHCDSIHHIVSFVVEQVSDTTAVKSSKYSNTFSTFRVVDNPRWPALI